MLSFRIRIVNCIGPEKVSMVIVDQDSHSTNTLPHVCCIYALLSSNPPECQDWGKGGGGSSQSWQCQDFQGACYSTPSLSGIGSPIQKTKSACNVQQVEIKKIHGTSERKYVGLICIPHTVSSYLFNSV